MFRTKCVYSPIPNGISIMTAGGPVAVVQQLQARVGEADAADFVERDSLRARVTVIASGQDLRR